jgi:predicted AAA+ superfamily ATPase
MFEQHQHHGNLFENYVVSEIAKKEIHRNTHSELFYYRTSHGVEVDLLIDRRSSVEYVEIKSSRKFQSEMVQSIVTLKKRNEKAVLLYQGKSLTHFNDIDIQNYADYLME